MPTPRTLLKELRMNPSPDRAEALLRQLCGLELPPRELLALHEALLFYKAYPLSEALRRFCESELKGFAKRIASLSPDDRAQLDQTGIAGTRILYPYDLPMVRWLMKRLGDKIEIDWDSYEERDDDPLSEYLPMLLESTAQDALDEGIISSRDLLEAVRGSSFRTSLAWLVRAFEKAFPSPIREHLYNGMQLTLTLDLGASSPSRTLSDDGKPDQLSIWDPSQGRPRFDLIAEAQKIIPMPDPVPKARGEALLNLVYSTLLPRLRELFPATHGNPEEVYEFPLERGVCIVFWFMKAEWRLPLEAGWGLLALRNGVPIGYGAGGMLEDRSEIAINVFDTFRGGEAAWLYSQYARIFNSVCGARWLVTRKYQIGYENEEGLASGAYWFYDKLGFRSVDAGIRKLADSERKKIAKQKGYRSPRSILKKLCQADIALSLAGQDASEYEEFPLGAAGLAAARAAAMQTNAADKLFGIDQTGWTQNEKTRFAQMIPFLLICPNFEKWPEADRKMALDLCRLKGSAREADYARLMSKAKRFFAELRKAAVAG